MKAQWLKLCLLLLVLSILAVTTSAKKQSKKSSSLNDESKDDSSEEASKDKSSKSTTTASPITTIHPKMKPMQNKAIKKKMDKKATEVIRDVPIITEEISLVQVRQEVIETREVNTTTPGPILSHPEIIKCVPPTDKLDSVEQLKKNVTSLWAQVSALSHPIHIHVHGGNTSPSRHHGHHGNKGHCHGNKGGCHGGMHHKGHHSSKDKKTGHGHSHSHKVKDDKGSHHQANRSSSHGSHSHGHHNRSHVDIDRSHKSHSHDYRNASGTDVGRSHKGHSHSHKGRSHSHKSHSHSHKGHSHSHKGHSLSHKGRNHSHKSHSHGHRNDSRVYTSHSHKGHEHGHHNDSRVDTHHNHTGQGQIGHSHRHHGHSHRGHHHHHKHHHHHHHHHKDHSHSKQHDRDQSKHHDCDHSKHHGHNQSKHPCHMNDHKGDSSRGHSPSRSHDNRQRRNFGEDGGHSTHVHIHVTIDEKPERPTQVDHAHEHENTTEKAHAVEEAQYARCDIDNHEANNHLVGYILLRQTNLTVLEVKVNISGFHAPSPGDEDNLDTDIRTTPSPVLHGFHVHQFGDFSQGCLSFGGHYNPEGAHHGGLEHHERHVGDWGNLEVNNLGVATKYLTVNDATLRGFHSIIGRGIVVHGQADDLGEGDVPASKTTGNAGSRLACCVIGWSKEFPANVWAANEDL